MQSIIDSFAIFDVQCYRIVFIGFHVQRETSDVVLWMVIKWASSDDEVVVKGIKECAAVTTSCTLFIKHNFQKCLLRSKIFLCQIMGVKSNWIVSHKSITKSISFFPSLNNVCKVILTTKSQTLQCGMFC